MMFLFAQSRKCTSYTTSEQHYQGMVTTSVIINDYPCWSNLNARADVDYKPRILSEIMDFPLLLKSRLDKINTNSNRQLS